MKARLGLAGAYTWSGSPEWSPWGPEFKASTDKLPEPKKANKPTPKPTPAPPPAARPPTTKAPAPAPQPKPLVVESDSDSDDSDESSEASSSEEESTDDDSDDSEEEVVVSHSVKPAAPVQPPPKPVQPPPKPVQQQKTPSAPARMSLEDQLVAEVCVCESMSGTEGVRGCLFVGDVHRGLRVISSLCFTQHGSTPPESILWTRSSALICIHPHGLVIGLVGVGVLLRLWHCIEGPLGH